MRYALEVLAVAALFALLTIPNFRPFSLHPGSLLFDIGDSSLHTWILWWDVHKMTAGLAGLFDANIFYPHPDALAYSDHLLGSAIIAAPFILIWHNPVLALNMVGILSYILGGLGMYLLVRRFVPGRGAAIIAGMVYAYCPWRMGQLGHQTQLLTGQWMPFALLFLHRTLETRKWRDALLFCLFFTWQALCSYYLAALMGTAVVTVIIAELISKKWRIEKAVWIRLAAAGAISAAVIVPTMIPYYHVQKAQGLERSIDECIQLSADPLDYLAAPPWNMVWGRTLYAKFSNHYSKFANENVLFPGFLAVLLAGIGLLRVSFHYKDNRPFNRRAEARIGLEWEHVQGVYFALAVTAFILTLGPQLHVFWRLTWVPLPYKLFYYIVPGFKALRVPTRFAYLLMLAMAILAAYGYRNIEKRISVPWRKYALMAIVGGGIFIEYLPTGLPSVKMPMGDDIPPVYKWLAAKPADATLTELPQYLDLQLSPEGLYDPQGFLYMYYSGYHHFQPTTNGRSGFVPPDQFFIWKILENFPSPDSLKLLEYLGIKYVVVHSGRYPGDTGRKVVFMADNSVSLKKEAVFGSDHVYGVSHTEPRENIGKLDGIQITSMRMPPKVRPHSLADLEVQVTDSGRYPAIGLKLIDIEAAVTQSGARGTETLKSAEKIRIALMPGENKWISMPIRTPAWDGKYRWDVRVNLPGYPGIENAASLDFEAGPYPDSSNPGLLRAEFIEVYAPSVVKPGEQFYLRARVKNTGDTFWRYLPRRNSLRGVVFMGVRYWSKMNSVPLPIQPRMERNHPDRFIGPGEETLIGIRLWAPKKPGQYIIHLDMVDELIVWFEDAGSEPFLLPIEVKAE